MFEIGLQNREEFLMLMFPRKSRDWGLSLTQWGRRKYRKLRTRIHENQDRLRFLHLGPFSEKMMDDIAQVKSVLEDWLGREE
ncbi:hypothetical protein Droror1_Dr00014657 [Drosera rotundifolia]